MRWGAVKYLLMGFALAGVGFAVGAKWQGNGLGAADVFNQTVVNPAAPHEATLTVAKNDAPLSLNPREGAESATPSSANVAPAASAQLTVLFSPEDPIQRTLIGMINNAQRNILVQAYLLTDDTIANALIRAHKRGVNVEVLLDAQMVSNARGSDGVRLYEAGIPVRLETRYENAHNKIMIFDHDTANAAVVTGSYNFTYGAQRSNAENVVIIRQSPTVIKRYVDNWRAHAADAVAYAGNPVS